MAVAVADQASPGDAFDLLDEAVDELAATDGGALCDEALAAAMLRFEAAQARLDAERVRLTGEFDARKLWAADAAKSAAAWLAHKTRAPKPDCAARARLARLCRLAHAAPPDAKPPRPLVTVIRRAANVVMAAELRRPPTAKSGVPDR